MNNSSLLVWTSKGLYCPVGDFFIDPMKKVDRAVITHGHSDHARSGSKAYLTVAEGAGILKARISKKSHVETIDYREAIDVNGVRLSFHSAGHILGSSQVRLEHRGEVWVVSGDYKLQPDPTCAPLETVRCHTFVSECTFGLPIYRWPSTDKVLGQINRWWQGNRERGAASFLHVYSLGKAQRILAGIDASIGPIFVHSAVDKINKAYLASGVCLPAYSVVDNKSAVDLRGALVLGPVSDPAACAGTAEYAVASASGWMRTRRRRKSSGLDYGFILSDHADWNDLLHVIQSTGAERLIAMNGFVQPLTRWFREHGLQAAGLQSISSTLVEGDCSSPQTSLMQGAQGAAVALSFAGARLSEGATVVVDPSKGPGICHGDDCTAGSDSVSQGVDTVAKMFHSVGESCMSGVATQLALTGSVRSDRSVHSADPEQVLPTFLIDSAIAFPTTESTRVSPGRAGVEDGLAETRVTRLGTACQPQHCGPSFGDLCLQLDNNSYGKIAILSDYLQNAPTAESVAALRLLRGLDSRQTLRASSLRDIAINAAGMTEWMYRLCHDESGDLVETISLIVPLLGQPRSLPANELVDKVEHLHRCTPEERAIEFEKTWRELCYEDRMVLNRMVAGGFRVEEPCLAPAIARYARVDARAVEYQLKNSSGTVDCDGIIRKAGSMSHLMPHPFHTVNELEAAAALQGLAPSDLSVEMCWEGVRCQLVRRDENVLLWSSDGALLSDSFPELVEAAAALPDMSVLEGTVLGWKQADVLPGATLKRRLKSPANKKLREDVPVIFMVHDLLEEHGEDLRNCAFSARRARLEALLKNTEGKSAGEVLQLQLFAPCRLQLNPLLRLSHPFEVASVDEISEQLKSVESLGAEGFLVKQRSAAYGSCGAPWFQLSPLPVVVNAALVSVKVPRSESEELEYTLALLRNGELVPVAKMSSLDLSDQESNRLLDFIRNNTLEKFGPVRVIKPEQVFELACVGVQDSSRHKAGLTVRRSRILRWCGEVQQHPIHTVDALKSPKPGANGGA